MLGVTSGAPGVTGMRLWGFKIFLPKISLSVSAPEFFGDLRGAVGRRGSTSYKDSWSGMKEVGKWLPSL